MTDDRDLIGEYLDQLRLSLRIPEVGRILVEAEDHLREAAAAGEAAGLTEAEAQWAAIARFGPVHAIVYAHQTRHGRVAAMLADLGIAVWRVAAWYLLACCSLRLHGLLWEAMSAARPRSSRAVPPGQPAWSCSPGTSSSAACSGAVAVGLAVTYAGRMVRMLAAQHRGGRRELA